MSDFSNWLTSSVESVNIHMCGVTFIGCIAYSLSVKRNEGIFQTVLCLDDVISRE